MTVLRGWCTSQPLTANPPFPSRQAQPESGVRGNVPAPFGAGERLEGPPYRYRHKQWKNHVRYHNSDTVASLLGPNNSA